MTGLEWPEVDEPYDSLEANALHKARTVVGHTGVAALADDTGLEVAALGGAPGVFTARFAGPAATYADNVTKLLAELDGVAERSARFRTAVALVYTDGLEVTAEGVLEGRIALDPAGRSRVRLRPGVRGGGVRVPDPGRDSRRPRRTKSATAPARCRNSPAVCRSPQQRLIAPPRGLDPSLAESRRRQPTAGCLVTYRRRECSH